MFSVGVRGGVGRRPLRAAPSSRRVIPPSDDEDDDDDDDPMGMLGDLPGSPTPSVATTFGGGGEGEDDDERADVVGELGGFRAPHLQPGAAMKRRVPMARSNSAPVGVFGTLLAPGREGSAGLSGDGAMEAKNKAVSCRSHSHSREDIRLIVFDPGADGQEARPESASREGHQPRAQPVPRRLLHGRERRPVRSRELFPFPPSADEGMH